MNKLVDREREWTEPVAGKTQFLVHTKRTHKPKTLERSRQRGKADLTSIAFFFEVRKKRLKSLFLTEGF
jgi:hypothetical protein